MELSSFDLMSLVALAVIQLLTHSNAINHFLSCIVLFCSTVHYCLLSYFIFSLLTTCSINLNLKLNLTVLAQC